MKKSNLNILKIVYISIITMQLSSCAAFLVKSKQEVTINPGSDSTSIYIYNEEEGIGKTTTKVKKHGFLGLALKTNGHPMQYEVLVSSRYYNWLTPVCIADVAFIGFGFIELYYMGKMHLYPKYNEFELLPKLVTRQPNNIYIKTEMLKYNPLNVKEQNGKFKFNLSIAENMKFSDKTALELAKLNASEKKQLNDQPQLTSDINRTNILYKNLNKLGFIDTISEVFYDHNNTIIIEPTITSLTTYYFNGVSPLYTGIYRQKISTNWNIKNAFGEKLDSVNTETTSGNFTFFHDHLMVEDVTNQSLQDFLRSDVFKEYAIIDTNFAIKDAPLIITKPINRVTNADDATQASVIIKCKNKGHGSGFAISNDGYILTNYHVIAGEYANNPSQVTVILYNGLELPATVVRYNKKRDVALLKVDANFEKAFQLSNQIGYKRLMQVYAIGTPKSIELGQSVTLGLISNERNSNNNNLLQLGMSVNAGNSGGPLFDKQGNLHGIVTSKLVGFSTEGVSFAIPAYAVAEYLNLK